MILLGIVVTPAVNPRAGITPNPAAAEATTNDARAEVA